MSDEKTTNLIDLNKVVLVDKDAMVSLIAQQADQLSKQNSQSGNASTLVESVMKMLTGSRNDEDVGATEVLRAIGPAVAAGVTTKVLDNMLQSSVAGWDALNQARLVNIGAITHAKELNSANSSSYVRNQVMAEKNVGSVVTEPNYFKENAPAAQDTPGEGSDSVAVGILDAYTLGWNDRDDAEE